MMGLELDYAVMGANHLLATHKTLWPNRLVHSYILQAISPVADAETS
jgi:hypothetical protein